MVDMGNYMDLPRIHTNGNWMRIDAIAPGTFRIRINKTGNFTDPALIRYGIINIPDTQQPVSDHCMLHTSDSRHTTIKSGQAELHTYGEDRQLNLTHTVGERSVQTWCSLSYCSSPENGNSYEIRFSLCEHEAFYGLGSIASEQIQRRGLRAMIWVENNILEGAPIPFLMSSNGWAILMNTTWMHTFDIGHTDSETFSIAGFDGELDFFLFAGSSYGDLLNKYTAIAGRPQLLPLKMYGLGFCSRENSNAKEILDDALKFRQSGTPCDLIGIAKGWTKVPNDPSTEKQWHPEYFPTSSNLLLRNVTLIGILQKHGFKLSLTMECDYDLTAEEERKLSRDKHDLVNRNSNEPWYAHLRKFVEDGATAFLVTINKTVYTHQDRIWSNGMSSDELRNLYAVILGKQMNQGFREQTGTRPFIHIGNGKGYTGMQQYMATTTGNYYNGQQAIVALLNFGLSGHTNTSTNMHLISREGIHADFLLTWSRVNNTQYFQHPGFLQPPLNTLFQIYAKLRYRLIPYLYSVAHIAALTGMPITRAMPLMYPNDWNCRDLNQQYMLGDSLLVAVYTTRIYLPEGVWIDYWTGKTYMGETSLDYTIPDHAGGPLFIRAGAILPMWPQLDFIGQSEIQTITLHIYPYQYSEFTLYEDDGVSLRHLEGEIATTHMDCSVEENQMIIRIAKRDGTYQGMPGKRLYEVFIHMDSKPSMVKVNGERRQDYSRRSKVVLLNGWRYDRLHRTIHLLVEEKAAYVEASSGVGVGASTGAMINSENTVRIEVHFPAKANSKNRRQADTTGTIVHRTSSGSDVTLEKIFLSALDTGELSRAEIALNEWSVIFMKKAATNETWPLQLMNICHVIIQQMEHRGWEARDVFAGKMNILSFLQDLDSPEKGFQLIQQMVHQYIQFAQSKQENKQHPVISQIVTIIEQELDQDLSLKHMAERVSMHPVNLSRKFKSETGQYFSDYVMTKRMTNAKKLLETGLNVYETADRIGFKEAGNFSRAFSKYWGVPPIHFKYNRTKR